MAPPSNKIDGAFQITYSIPGPIYIGLQSDIEALTGVQEGAFAVGYTVTPADGVFGFYDGSAWVWGSGGGGGAVDSVNGQTGVVVLDAADVGAEPALGYTPENVANKSTDVNADQASNTKYPSVKAVYDWAIGLFVQKNAPITPATNPVITYDAKGLVTGGTTLSASDMPSGIDAQKIGAGAVDNTEYGYLNGVTSAIQTQLNGKQASLGYTPEDVANKKTTMTGNETSNTFYLSVKAVYDWVIGLFTQLGTNGYTLSSQSLTNAGISATEGYYYVLDISGLVADQDFTLPTPSAANKKIMLEIRVGDNQFVLKIKRNGVELTRVFISGEVLEFNSIGTGAGDWEVINDGRIPCYCRLERQSAQSIASATYPVVVQLTTNAKDIGNIGNTSTYKITCRRANSYKILGVVIFTNSFSDQKNIQSIIHYNGNLDTYQITYTSTPTTSQPGMARTPYERTLAVGDYLELIGFQNQGVALNTSTTIGYPMLSAEEILTPLA